MIIYKCIKFELVLKRHRNEDVTNRISCFLFRIAENIFSSIGLYKIIWAMHVCFIDGTHTEDPLVPFATCRFKIFIPKRIDLRK